MAEHLGDSAGAIGLPRNKIPRITLLVQPWTVKVSTGHLQKSVFIGLAENSQDLDGNPLVVQQPLPNIPVATSIDCSISDQLDSFESHAFWVQAGGTRQL
jgi:hypothetical protein